MKESDGLCMDCLYSMKIIWEAVECLLSEPVKEDFDLAQWRGNMLIAGTIC